jgi:hypothetical protein
MTETETLRAELERVQKSYDCYVDEVGEWLLDIATTLDVYGDCLSVLPDEVKKVVRERDALRTVVDVVRQLDTGACEMRQLHEALVALDKLTQDPTLLIHNEAFLEEE